MSQDLTSLLTDETRFIKIAKIAFDSVDTDGSGEIDIKEFKQIIEKLAKELDTNPPEDEEFEEIMEQLDTDRSGKIDFEEFKVLIRDLLENMLTPDF